MDNKIEMELCCELIYVAEKKNINLCLKQIVNMKAGEKYFINAKFIQFSLNVLVMGNKSAVCLGIKKNKNKLWSTA